MDALVSDHDNVLELAPALDLLLRISRDRPRFEPVIAELQVIQRDR